MPGVAAEGFQVLGLASPNRLEVYPGLLHEIFNEPEQEEVFADLLGWLRGLESAVRVAAPTRAGQEGAGRA